MKTYLVREKTSQPKRQPKSVDPVTQSKQLESKPPKDNKAGKSKLIPNSLPESRTSYLPTPRPGPRQANTGKQKTDKNALLHLLPPVGETNQNRHGKTNRNPTKHKQKPKSKQISHLLPPPQIVKKTFGIRGFSI